MKFDAVAYPLVILARRLWVKTSLFAAPPVKLERPHVPRMSFIQTETNRVACRR